MTKVADIYRQTGDFMECVRQTGLPAFKVHIILAKAGLLTKRHPLFTGCQVDASSLKKVLDEYAEVRTK